MSDRELLDLAAKAAGYPIHSDAWACGFGGGTPKLYMGERGPVWNPLTSNADAFQLQVRLRMLVDVVNNASGAQILNVTFRSEPHNGDPEAATRRAITMAAADFGKAMP